jgi:hypothetical protein
MDGFSRTQSSSLEQSTASLYNEGVKFRKVGLHEDAEHKFRAALVRDRRHLPSLLGLGSLLRERGREREGVLFLQEASGIVAAPVRAPVFDLICVIAEAKSLGLCLRDCSGLSAGR